MVHTAILKRDIHSRKRYDDITADLGHDTRIFESFLLAPATMVSAAQPQDSPGNAYYPGTYPMRKPQLGFVYRLECNIADKEVLVGAPHGAGVVRSIAPITGGTFKGPELQGKVLPGGADWATVIEGTHVSYNSSLTRQQMLII